MKSVFQAHPDFAGIISEKIKIPLAGHVVIMHFLLNYGSSCWLFKSSNVN